MDATNLVAWLPFDESTTLDRCGGTWTTSGSPMISDENAINGKALQLASGSYVMCDSVTIGGQDFTIHGYCYMNSSSGNWARVFEMPQVDASDTNIFFLGKYQSGADWTLTVNGARANFAGTFNQRIHFALVYQHDTATTKCYIDGELKATLTNQTVARVARKLRLGKSSWSADGVFVGSIDEFMIYDGVALWTENFTPPTATEYEELAFQLDSHVSFTVDVERVVQNDAYIKQIAQSLKVWLPFNESTTADKCGNEWTAYGSPTINATNAINGKALQLSGGSYLSMDSKVTIGGADFTIDGYCYFNSSSTGNPRIFELVEVQRSNRNEILFFSSTVGTKFAISNAGTFNSPTGIWNERFHFEMDYEHATSTLKVYLNGELAGTIANKAINRVERYLLLGSSYWNDGVFIGSIDEFRIFDGVALHTENFTPPTAEDYADLAFQLDSTVTFTVDVERRISNRVEFTVPVERKIINAWRYVNLGTATTLTVTGTTLENLSEDKSVTGTAFYQTARAKCFDLPATDEVWMKFDVYFDGSNRWRAYNGGANGFSGVTAQTTNTIYFFSNENEITGIANAAKKNQLQTVILHMVSGSTAGVVEAWVDGTKIYTYTGDVNHGEDFADIFLQSDGAGTFFSNVVISNRQLTQADGYQTFTADVERKLSNIVEFTADVQRGIMEVINVPFIFGDHFNHCCSVEYDAPTTSIGRPLKIKLPNKSKAYVHATALNGGAFKVFSDTDAVGTVTGDVYAALDECESVFVQKVVAPQSILYMFLNSLRYRGGSALDSAIENCTYGVFPSKDELVNSFLNDLDNSESNLDFLSRCCGVDLSNDDTGAVIGSDAGGGYPKTAKSIVPEPVPVEDWIVPEKGSSKTIAGLTVYFPTSGYKGTLTDAENHILAGLNSVWIEQALLLIQRSCNIDFRTNQTNIVHDISVKFVDENNDALAYVSITTKDGSTTSLELRVNMRRYSGINMTSEDGAAGNNTYLDRVLAHEMTHAVMAARIKNYTELPRFLREGIAEFIHGIDDERKSDIQYLTQTAQRNTLQSIFSTGGDSGDINIYSAGYLFFRYMIKQTLEKGTFPLERYSSTGHIRLFISDGAVDYFGNALTDNTRAIFSADVQRELVRTTSFNADVAIFDMIRVEFAADVMRSIVGKVKLYAGDNSAYFDGSSSGGELTPVVIPSQSLTDIGRSPAAPNNTNDLQSVEITIAEQQITENVHFVGNVPFDIMYPVRGQYLDYLIDMRVERVQKHGILYSCDCCSDIDEILFTQLAYTVPKTMTWNDVRNGETIEKETHYPPASVHVQNLAAALGLQAVMQFEDFLSTVTSDDIGGATYADLIRELFNWSSRVPTQMINYFIRNGVLYIVQRGYEARLIDLSLTKHTIPIILHELVRMTWGATPWSKTQTIEEIRYRPPKSKSGSSSDTGGNTGDGSSSDDTLSGGGTGDDTISGGDDSGGSDPDNPDDDNDGNEKAAWMNMDVVVVEDNEGVTRTNYDYDSDGVLQKVVAEFTSKTNEEENTITTTTHSYNSDGLLEQTVSEVEHPKAKSKTEDTKTVTTYGYSTWFGRVYLSTEMIEMYSKGKDFIYHLDDTRITTKSPTGRGQVATNDDSGNADSGGGTGDDRPTPYQESRTNLAKEAALENKLPDFPDMDEDKFVKQTAFNADHELNYYTEKLSRTVNGLSLYDSAFPIHNTGKLIALTNAIKWLNRRTKETVTMTIYEYPHLIDFNDRIIFEGNVYFLVSNTATTTERIFNEQRITMVRWY